MQPYLELLLRYEDGTEDKRKVQLPCEIGRLPNSNLRVKAWRVARRHARLYWTEAGTMVDDFGSLAGTHVNGQRISQYGPLFTGDEIVIGPCLMRVDHVPDPASSRVQDVPRVGNTAARVAAADCSQKPYDQTDFDEAQECVPHIYPHSSPDGDYPDSDNPASDIDVSLREDDDYSRKSHSDAVPQVVLAEPVMVEPDVSLQDRLHHRRRLHGVLLEALDLRRRDIAALSDQALRTEARSSLATIIAADKLIPDSIDRNELLDEVVDEAVGLGPLEVLLNDSNVSEIMVNRHDEIFVEKQGRLMRYRTGFSSEQAVQAVIERIVSPLGRRIDENSPMVDARLRDGSRVNAVIPPVALRGSSLTIRKFPLKRPSMDDLITLQTLDTPIRQFLEICVSCKKNIIVSGGTGSGKTTLLNILSNSIPAGERIVTIEDSAELRLGHEHLVSLEARPANLEGSGRVDIRDLVRNALRMRPDRIVIGECRGGEAFDMLAAMNTGHEGSLTTLHANSPRDALARLETMILMAGMDLPLPVVREHIAASVDIIVQQARQANGHRVINSVVEITGMESGRILLQELFRFEPRPQPAFVGCGVMPDFLGQSSDDACTLPAHLFSQRSLLVGAKAAGFMAT